MSAHWRVAFRNAAWIAALAAPVGGVVAAVYGGEQAWALLYGVCVGVVSVVSMALTVSLLTLRSPLWRVAGVASFVVRYGFAAGALGVPAYLGLWPIFAMLCGFAGVYLVENMVLVPGMLRTAGDLGVRRDDGRSVGDGAERRAEA